MRKVSEYPRDPPQIICTKIAFRFSKSSCSFIEKNVLTVKRVLTDCRLLRSQILPGLSTAVVTYFLIRA